MRQIMNLTLRSPARVPSRKLIRQTEGKQISFLTFFSLISEERFPHGDHFVRPAPGDDHCGGGYR